MQAEDEMRSRDKPVEAQHDVPGGIRAILCDVGGVLIYRAPTPELQRWEESLGLQPIELLLSVWFCEAAQQAMQGLASVEDVWYEIQQIYALTDMQKESFRQDFAAGDRVDTEFIQFLHNVRGTRKIALLSNAWPGARHLFGSEFGLETLTNTMILSYEEGLAKPDQRIYDLAATRLTLPHASIVFIDDFAPNVAAARACGMRGVHFQTREQAIAELQTLLFVE